MKGDRPRLAVFDRDGTLVDFHRDEELGVVTPAFHPSQLRFQPGAFTALRRWASAGHRIAIATNQPGAAKGELSRGAIARTNAAIVERLAAEGITVARVAVCLHHPLGGERGDPELVGPCACRKPAPGMLLAIARELGCSPADGWMVGDTLGDVLAGRAAGMRTALLSPTARCELCPQRAEPPVGAPPDVWAATLEEIVTAMLAAS